MDTASAIAPPRQAAQSLGLTYLELCERVGVPEVSAVGSGLCVGTVATPNVAGAMRRLAPEFHEDPTDGLEGLARPRALPRGPGVVLDGPRLRPPICDDVTVIA